LLAAFGPNEDAAVYEAMRNVLGHVLESLAADVAKTSVVSKVLCVGNRGARCMEASHYVGSFKMESKSAA